MGSLWFVFVGKAVRVFVFGMTSVMTPIYLATLGYSAFYVGSAIAAMIAGNIFSNLIVTLYGEAFGRKRFLLLFSSLMLASGLMLSLTESFPLMLLAFFLGNISTTGTEAGPFQSIETGILPKLVSTEKRNRAFGMYNLIGYGASSIGALAASIPYYLQNSFFVFRVLFLAYGLVGILLFVLYQQLQHIEISHKNDQKFGFENISSQTKREIGKLSALFSIDAFAGGFVTQSLLSYWFFLVYGATLGTLGYVFLIVNIITALSTFAASFIADRLGNLRTMVYTHLISNIFLVLVPLAGSLSGSLLFLFARQSVSQMDVPTRQAFMTEIFSDQERVQANAITNTSRSISSIFGAPVSGALLVANLLSFPILTGGFSKILYDLLIFYAYRRRVK